MTIENIKKRNIIIKTTKEFFDSRGYLELETPILSPTLIPESSIEIFSTTNIHPFKENKTSYLIPSPEIWLKRFLSENPTNIYEVSKCFRNSEQYGKQHNSEFTMLEYYTMGYDHLETLELTKQLIDYINRELPWSKLPKKSLILSMENAFITYAGFSLKENYTIPLLHKKATELNINTNDDDNWETAFNRVFIDIVEPNLPKNVNLFLTDFPAKIPTLAKRITNTPWAQRWELYINGIECGNCYTEENDPEIVNEYFNQEASARINSITQHEIDHHYPCIFDNFPNCSGGALGIDRLIMTILGIANIQGVILFPSHDNI